MAPSAKNTPPWNRPAPKGKRTKLTEASRKKAAARARRGGRAYPNLVDNMRAAAEQKAPKKRGRK